MQLPSEIWANIIHMCADQKDLWLNLRHVNQQLHAGVEKHFADNIIKDMVISLPIRLPSYDARSQAGGKAIFRFYKERLDGHTEHDAHSVFFKLSETEPERHLDPFLGRWRGMTDGGRIRESVKFDVKLPERHSSARLEDCCAVTKDIDEGQALLKFDWQPTLTDFYR
ncbi:hypothetical protein CLAFUW4_14195 [Fulvia fulva]|uniref:Uncharacterized protein n=1 Tax=Passalora fulva TaxID=5499 RepID=A0A9Q8PLH1_PASFU|nr:uncharacterized protein CLAFUR5_14027 [Fulvia fulva]KAK4610173.1 hypothetical protein CLAFUR4_14198 [Fulvia fulva]KAK4611207.1 hypothetical protein CLAFUR0_14202 [Fulvia fulva]UJO24726.1 hypothetical protein CLAFUR5_14027 [Fulvia fulva]WPV21803.1 hypothetical protein CLAFUW4_14195 [Fulvia fulva]WPV37334.1 hypothetical protein CLAFUW7_14206 [Fulvia fulva]